VAGGIRIVGDLVKRDAHTAPARGNCSLLETAEAHREGAALPSASGRCFFFAHRSASAEHLHCVTTRNPYPVALFALHGDTSMKIAKQAAKPTSFRLSADIRQLLQQAALQERRSQTAMLEVMVQQWSEQHGLVAKRGRA